MLTKIVTKMPQLLKLIGVFPQEICKKISLLFSGFDDVFMALPSCVTDVRLSDVEAFSKLEVMAATESGSLAIAKTKDSRFL